MNVVVIHKAPFNTRPPVISVVLILSELGHDVTLIDEGVDEYWSRQLSNRGVKHYEIQPSKRFGKFSKIYGYQNFHKKVFSLLLGLSGESQPLVWIEGAYTILSLGKKIKKYKYVLQIQELHEKYKYQLKAIEKVISEAETVFMPEYNRASIYQVWFKLLKRPVVLPNKPYFIPREKDLNSIKEKYSDILGGLTGKKVLLFQGHMRDVEGYVKAIKELGDSYVLLLVGRDCGFIEEWMKINPNIIFVDYIPAPDYLIFTSIAHIGILKYETDQINNIFCAPNKIFEYSAFGVPMIGNDIPGLKFTIEYSNAGIVVDDKSIDSIIAGIKHIESHYDEYQVGSINFFKNTDNKLTIKRVLDRMS